MPPPNVEAAALAVAAGAVVAFPYLFEECLGLLLVVGVFVSVYLDTELLVRLLD